MCIKLSVHYKGCNCLRESLNPCPTFQKKRSGFWNSLFGAFKHEKHCGKVRRSRQSADGACDDCAITARGLRPHRVGDGANLPRRKVADESFRKEHHDGGRKCPRHRRRRSAEKYRNNGYDLHDGIPTNANAWIPNLYDEIKQVPLAPPPEYGRKYAPAPPVCPPRSSKSTREREHAQSSSSSSRNKHREKKRRSGNRNHDRHGKSTSHDRHGKFFTSDYSTREDWPLRAPPEPRPAQKPGGFRTQGPNGPPPEVLLPPLPRQARTFAQHMAADSGSGVHVPSFSRPVRTDYYTRHQQRPAVPVPPTSFMDMVRQEAFTHPLRREPRHVQRHAPPPPPLNVRPPLYKEYLQEQNSELMQRYGGWKPTAPRPMPAVKPKPAEAPKRSKLRDIGAAFGFEHGDSDSDVSFACVDARKIEREPRG
ncbi:hypothetical protein PG988_008870 [Apiospora saccharicola]